MIKAFIIADKIVYYSKMSMVEVFLVKLQPFSLERY